MARSDVAHSDSQLLLLLRHRRRRLRLICCRLSSLCLGEYIAECWREHAGFELADVANAGPRFLQRTADNTVLWETLAKEPGGRHTSKCRGLSTLWGGGRFATQRGSPG